MAVIPLFLFIIVMNSLSTAGPTANSSMTLTLLHTRDVGPNVQFRLFFNISFGVSSRISCTRGTASIFSGEGIVSGVNYEVVRPLYTSSSEPNVIRVSFEQAQTRTGAQYSCTVTAVGRRNIVSASDYDYDYDVLGSATSAATITGECMSEYTLLFYTIGFLPSVAGTPTGVTATRNGYNSVLVSWTAPSPAPAGYEVFHQTTSNATRLSVGNTTSTMMTVTGLTLGVTNYIFVVSFGAEGAPVLPSFHSIAAQFALRELHKI